MGLSYTSWRANVRAAYAAGTSNPEHRGPWGYPGTERQSDFGFRRGRAREWPLFGRYGILHLLTAETYDEHEHEVYSYLDATPDASGDRIYDYEFSAEVVVQKNRIRRAASIDDTGLNTNFAYRLHSSATPYGEGLYDAHGLILIYAPTNRHEVVDVDGTLGGVDSDTTTTDIEEYVLRYESDFENINGLDTHCRVVAQQQYHGPAIAFRPDVDVVVDLPGSIDDVVVFTDIPFLPLETNPDGETVDGLGNPQVEVYFTDTFLRSLVNGEFLGTMVRLSGSAGATVPSHDETDNLDNVTWSHNWVRNGYLSLTIESSSAAWTFDGTDVNFDQTDITFG